MKKLAIYIFTVISILFSACSTNGLDKDAFVLDVKSLSFEKETLLFGNEQDIMISGLPDSVLSVTRFNDGFIWWLNKPAYVIFDGNQNPNAIGYDTIRTIAIGRQVINRVQIDEILQLWFKNIKKDERRYVLLVDVLKNQIDPAFDLKTLIAFDKGEKKLILLDNDITINDFRRFKSNDTIHSNSLKIEFFRTFHNKFLQHQELSWWDKIIGKHLFFHKGDTCFTASVKSFYTPFGANEITLMKSGNATKISFNKNYRALIPKQSIDSVYQHNERVPVSLRQILYANTYSNEVYAPNIANPDYWEFGTIDGDYNFVVEQRSCLQNGEKESYLLNKINFYKGLLPLFVVFVFGLVVICWATRYEYISDSGQQGDNNRYKWYFVCLYSILFLLGVGRIFIGYNLSFTQPFTVYAFPTAVIVSPLILLCVLLLWLVFLCMEFGFKNILGLDDWKKRIWLILVFACVIAIIQFLPNFLLPDIFEFYWKDFTLQHCNPLGENKLVFCQTILLLVLTSLFWTVALIFEKKFKNENWLIQKLGIDNLTELAILIYIIVIMAFFFSQQSSVSISLLLFCVIAFWLLSEKWFEIDLQQPVITKRITKLIFVLLPLIVIGFIAFLRHDSGYIINLWFFPIIMVVILVYQYHYHGFPSKQSFGSKTRNTNTLISMVVIVIVVGIVLGFAWINAKNYDPFSSDRLVERSVAYFDFSIIQEWGYRLSEERAQFFAELAKYSYPWDFDCYEPAHSGISGFIDPVVENDLSVPFGLINQFGTKFWLLPIVCFTIIWCGLCFLVLKMSVKPKEEQQQKINCETRYKIYFSTYGIIRLFCMSLVVSSGVWLILSYYGVVPFTGRLIYGLGQDSIGEVFETVFLFAFMGLCGKAKDNLIIKNNNSKKQ